MNLTTIKGIGEKSELLLNKLGIQNIEDLLEYYPYNYTIYKFNDIKECSDNEQVIVQGKIDSLPVTRYFRAKLNSINFRFYTSNKLVNVTIYNRAFLIKFLKPGRTITITGKYNEKKNLILASNIILDNVNDGSIESKYHLTLGLTNKQIIKYITDALNISTKLNDYIPDKFNEKYKFISKEAAIKKIHFPNSIQDIKISKTKLIYEELFKFMFKINYLKYVNTKEQNKTPKIVNITEIQNFLSNLPFELTEDQITAIKQIHKDLTSRSRMNRLLCGDVGSGKTIVSVIAAYECALSGYQTALMAPTEILASQHFENIKNLLAETNIKVELLLGSTKKKEKEEIYNKLKNGEIDLLIGTHALLSDKVKFKNLGLVVTDEQHRFGVNQRNSLRNKGNIPDILYMSATPIPRTYALTIYGDMDVSLIKTKPKGRKEIKTQIKNEKEIKEVLYMMLDEIKKGHQIYVVTPLIEESETTEASTVNELKEKLDTAFNNKVKTEILHGKLTNEEKEITMDKFKKGIIKVLISTTVIEVGVDVPNATMMVIFDAERFGLATLHQLRGRIGRNSLDSTCILIGSNKNKRLKVLEESNDGFYITEKDFEMRKEGDLFGVKQSGDMAFKIADIKRDFKILMQAKEDSESFLLENIRNNFKNYENYYKIINEIKSLD
jgi:ATP-dependent DNA helicase RecG